MSYPELGALEAQAKELIALVGDLSDADFERATRCEGWTVKDVCAHVTASAERFSGLVEGRPAAANTDRVRWWRMPDRTDPNVIRVGAKEAATATEPQDVLPRLEAATSRFVDALRRTDPDQIVGDEWRALTAREFAANRCLEFGVHTMDVGHATLRGERIHPDAARYVVEILKALLEDELPAGLGWDDRTFILVGMGRREFEPNERFALGPLADRFPLIR